MSLIVATGRWLRPERLASGLCLLLAAACQDASDPAEPVVAAAFPGPVSGGTAASAGATGRAGLVQGHPAVLALTDCRFGAKHRR